MVFFKIKKLLSTSRIPFYFFGETKNTSANWPKAFFRETNAKVSIF
jgi:hypothetical protein